MSNFALNLTPNLYDYLQKNSLREHDILQQLREQTQKMSTHKMQITPEQGQFLQILIELLNAKKALEIGVLPAIVH